MALGIAAIGSFFAGCVATIIIAGLGVPLSALALKFGPADYFALMVVAFTTVSGLLGASRLRGLISLMLGVAIGHFFGPIRAVIALVAGIVKMPFWPFQIANFAASFAWGFGLIYGAGRFSEYMMQFTGK